MIRRKPFSGFGLRTADKDGFTGGIEHEEVEGVAFVDAGKERVIGEIRGEELGVNEIHIGIGKGGGEKSAQGKDKCGEDTEFHVKSLLLV